MCKGSVAFSAGCGSGYRDGVHSLEVIVESLSGGSRSDGESYGAEKYFKCSRRLWREANWVRLSVTS